MRAVYVRRTSFRTGANPEPGRLAYPAAGRGPRVCTGASPHPRVSSCLPVEGMAMDIVDLPGEIGQWAKKSGINLSQTLARRARGRAVTTPHRGRHSD
jgi:hypothetical protein